jgi:hypothetical protein
VKEEVGIPATKSVDASYPTYNPGKYKIGIPPTKSVDASYPTYNPGK